MSRSLYTSVDVDHIKLEYDTQVQCCCAEQEESGSTSVHQSQGLTVVAPVIVKTVSCELSQRMSIHTLQQRDILGRPVDS